MPGGAIVGLLRVGTGGKKASVARVGPRAPARVVDLGAVTGDDPPPRPFVRGTEVFAAGYVATAGDAGHRGERRLGVFRVTDSPELLVTVPQAGDGSPAFDAVALPADSFAGALLVWDENAPELVVEGGEEPRGVIRAALLAPDLRSVSQVATVSPDITDAERPRVALRDGGGFWVAWVARKREPSRDAGLELEVPAEDRAYRWVELLALDEHGRPAGAARRLSSASGHVAGFTMTATGSRLDATIVMDDEAVDGEGGEVLHVTALAEGAPRTISIRPVGAGRGTTPWVAWAPGTAGWLTFVDTTDHTHLVPLDADGAPAGQDSVEPLLDDARPVLAGAFDPARPGAPEVLAVSPSSGGALRWLTCESAGPRAPPFP